MKYTIVRNILIKNRYFIKKNILNALEVSTILKDSIFQKKNLKKNTEGKNQNF